MENINSIKSCIRNYREQQQKLEQELEESKKNFEKYVCDLISSFDCNILIDVKGTSYYGWNITIGDEDFEDIFGNVDDMQYTMQFSKLNETNGNIINTKDMTNIIINDRNISLKIAKLQYI